MAVLAKYTNGNYRVLILDDGTKIRVNNGEPFAPTRFESVDIKITNQCLHNCPYCHEASSPTGDHADFDKYRSFLDSIHPYTELAIGGGNPLLHPDLDSFLEYCKERQFIPSMTVNWRDLIQQNDRIQKLTREKLIYGVGVSMPTPNDRISSDEEEILKNALAELPTAVCHLILGIHTLDYIKALARRLYSPQFLILGYKPIRRGLEFKQRRDRVIQKNIEDVKFFFQDEFDFISEELNFESVVFDNLALEQLELLEWFRSKSPENYMGDEGQFTMFVDLVQGEYAISSTSMERFPIGSLTADEIFENVRGGNR
ncbi:MAG: radical SAM protein [Thermoguttaceae bacterium]|nr:radical SAM protein [Thermoguttaceae bacterium]